MSNKEFQHQLSNEIRVSHMAAKQLRQIAEQDPDCLGVRLYTAATTHNIGTGFTLTKETHEYDTVYEKNGLKLYIDCVTLNLIRGIQIDFVSTSQGSGFLFKQPEE